MVSGKTVVIKEGKDPEFDVSSYQLMSPEGLSSWMASNPAYKVRLRGGKREVVRTNLGKDWFQWSGQRSYENGICFVPGPNLEGAYNPWRGFPVTPVQGNWKSFQRLVKEALCDGNDEHFEWLLDWMAIGIQSPATRFGVATVLRGAKGVGKGKFAYWYGQLFRGYFLHLSNERHLVGNFNAHLEGKLLVFADELIWGGDKKAEGVLKAYVTEERMPVERKGYDVEMRKNYGRLLVATNGRWAVPAGPGERRWFVLDVSSKFKGNYEFFAAVDEQMENGGLEAMMFDLQDRTVTTNQREPPKTTALADVASMGLESEQAWLLEALGTGRFYPLEGRLRSGIHVGAVDANDDGSPMIHSQSRFYRG